MQSTGHASTQAVSFVPTHGSQIMYAIESPYRVLLPTTGNETEIIHSAFVKSTARAITRWTRAFASKPCLWAFSVDREQFRNTSEPCNSADFHDRTNAIPSLPVFPLRARLQMPSVPRRAPRPSHRSPRLPLPEDAVQAPLRFHADKYFPRRK